MDLTSSDLELITEASSSEQAVGMRFNGLAIPQGATIVSAYVQFQVDETANLDPSALTIQGQAVDDALTFTAIAGDISSRDRTAAAVPWAPAAWQTVGEAGPDQQTPDIASVNMSPGSPPGTKIVGASRTLGRRVKV
jgi:hypothetical protein